MTTPSRAERLARAVLTCIAEPGDPVMGALLRVCAPAEIVAALTAGRAPVPSAAANPPPPGLPPLGLPSTDSPPAGLPPPGHSPADPPPAGLPPDGSRPARLSPAGSQPIRLPSAGLPPDGSQPAHLSSAGLAPDGSRPAHLPSAGLAPDGSEPARLPPYSSGPAGLPPDGPRPAGLPDASGQPANAPAADGEPGPGLADIPRPGLTDFRGLADFPSPTVIPGLADFRGLAAIPGLDRALRRWAARLGDAPSDGTLAAWQHDGIRLVVPGDAEWPSQLDVLGDARPWGLWVRGNADLRYSCLRSVSIVGTRAATAYGAHVCTEMAVTLAEAGWTVISGGAYGIDGCAHRGVVNAGGATIAVLACGVDYDYPQGHHGLFRSMRVKGATVSEWPPGRMPTRHGFLVRNRVITALSRGTVVVEAALRSGALNSARHAHSQNRPLMAVPGPVTSAQSAGCHEIIREWGAVCVTSARDVMDLLSFPTDDSPAPLPGPVMPRDQLDPVLSRVLDAVPARAGQGPARIAVAAGVDFDQVMSCLGGLAAAGFVERSERGWRLRRRSEEPP